MVEHKCGNECDAHQQKVIQDAYEDVDRQFWKGHPNEILIDESELAELKRKADYGVVTDARFKELGINHLHLSELKQMKQDAEKWRKRGTVIMGLNTSLDELERKAEAYDAVVERAKKELKQYQQLKSWMDIKGRAKDLCKVMGFEQPEWVK